MCITWPYLSRVLCKHGCHVELCRPDAHECPAQHPLAHCTLQALQVQQSTHGVQPPRKAGQHLQCGGPEVDSSTAASMHASGHMAGSLLTRL